MATLERKEERKIRWLRNCWIVSHRRKDCQLFFVVAVVVTGAATALTSRVKDWAKIWRKLSSTGSLLQSVRLSPRHWIEWFITRPLICERLSVTETPAEGSTAETMCELSLQRTRNLHFVTFRRLWHNRASSLAALFVTPFQSLEGLARCNDIVSALSDFSRDLDELTLWNFSAHFSYKLSSWFVATNGLQTRRSPDDCFKP